MPDDLKALQDEVAELKKWTRTAVAFLMLNVELHKFDLDSLRSVFGPNSDKVKEALGKVYDMSEALAARLDDAPDPIALVKDYQAEVTALRVAFDRDGEADEPA